MNDPTPRDYNVAVQVMQQRCEQTGKPLDVAWTADYFRELLSRVDDSSRRHVETTISVLDDMTRRFGESDHTIADVNLNAGLLAERRGLHI